MAVARHHFPIARADTHDIAIADTPIFRRNRRHERRVIAIALAQRIERRFVGQAVRREMRRRSLAARVRAVAGGHHAAHRVFAERHPQAHVPSILVAARADPVGKSQMIRMTMRDDHTQHRLSIEHGIEHALPVRADRIARNAAIDDGPAFHTVDFIGEQPQIDVIERERQRHAQPEHARRHFHDAARFGQPVRENIVELVFECVHSVPVSGFAPRCNLAKLTIT